MKYKKEEYSIAYDDNFIKYFLQSEDSYQFHGLARGYFKPDEQYLGEEKQDPCPSKLLFRGKDVEKTYTKRKWYQGSDYETSVSNYKLWFCNIPAMLTIFVGIGVAATNVALTTVLLLWTIIMYPIMYFSPLVWVFTPPHSRMLLELKNKRMKWNDRERRRITDLVYRNIAYYGIRKVDDVKNSSQFRYTMDERFEKAGI